MTVWKVFAGDALLGEITEVERDMWNVTGAFTPTTAFDAWRPRFEEKHALSSQLELTEDEDILDAFDDLENATAPPTFRLVDAETGKEHDFGLLHLGDAGAGFRLV